MPCCLRRSQRRRSPNRSRPRPTAFDASACLACHAPIKAFYDGGKHKTVGCNACHDGTAEHLADTKKRPVTKTDLATCGGCHQNQYKSYAQMDWHRTARFEKKQTTGPAPDPAYDLLMTPHGFTQGAQPAARAHVRAARPVRRRPRVRRPLRAEGRLALPRRHPATSRCGTSSSTSIPTTPTRRCSSRARRPRRIRCACRARRRTTSSTGRTWAIRCPAPSGAARRRSSSSRSRSNHALNCIFCHDPHAAKPRIVRDALIEAVTRTDFPTLYSQDPRKTKVDVKDMGVRGFTRKIGMLERYDGKLQCGAVPRRVQLQPGLQSRTPASRSRWPTSGRTTSRSSTSTTSSRPTTTSSSATSATSSPARRCGRRSIRTSRRTTTRRTRSSASTARRATCRRSRTRRPASSTRRTGRPIRRTT